MENLEGKIKYETINKVFYLKRKYIKTPFDASLMIKNSSNCTVHSLFSVSSESAGSWKERSV